MLSKDYELFFLFSLLFVAGDWKNRCERVVNVNMNVMTSTLTLSAVTTIGYAEVE